jgi:Chaperone of endosialidase
VGAGTLALNTADRNTATGAGALLSNSTGHDNTAGGAFCLFNNTTGHDNTAHGGGALFHNTTGFGNTTIGVNALFTNMIGSGNTAIGGAALYNTTSDANTAVGLNALFANTNGNGNTAVGNVALFTNTAGSDNTALGAGAGASVTGASNISVGQGVSGVAGENNTIRIGDNLPSTPGASRCYIGGIWAQQVTGNFSPVNVDNFGQLGFPASCRHFKHHIQPMEKTSEAILKLKPVTFQYKNDQKNTPCVGLIAEEVAAVNPDLVVRGSDGELVTVRYDAVNVMVLNEFLKEHKRVEEQQANIEQLKSDAAKQEATISELRKNVGVLASQLKEQAAQIQKVSAQIKASKAVERIALTNP